MTCEVLNLATGDIRTFVGIQPSQAVIAAYAQSGGDYNTWDYEKNYGAMVRENGLTVAVGNFSAFKDGRPIER